LRRRAPPGVAGGNRGENEPGLDREIDEEVGPDAGRDLPSGEQIDDSQQPAQESGRQRRADRDPPFAAEQTPNAVRRSEDRRRGEHLHQRGRAVIRRPFHHQPAEPDLLHRTGDDREGDGEQLQPVGIEETLSDQWPRTHRVGDISRGHRPGRQPGRPDRGLEAVEPPKHAKRRAAQDERVWDRLGDQDRHQDEEAFPDRPAHAPTPAAVVPIAQRLGHRLRRATRRFDAHSGAG